MTTTNIAHRRIELFNRLDKVLDPELDRSVIHMGFVTEVTIADTAVTIHFSLPTFWCATNFAFIMAEDLHTAARSLAWVADVTVILDDHHDADQINAAVDAGVPFTKAFPGQPSGTLDNLRAEFKRKAFYGRQSALLQLLLEDRPAVTVLSMCVKDLKMLATLQQPESTSAQSQAAQRYLDSLKDQGWADDDDNAVFIRLENTPINATDLTTHLRMIRRYRMSVDANAQLCGLYLQARRNDNRYTMPLHYIANLNQQGEEHV